MPVALRELLEAHVRRQDRAAARHVVEPLEQGGHAIGVVLESDVVDHDQSGVVERAPLVLVPPLVADHRAHEPGVAPDGPLVPGTDVADDRAAMPVALVGELEGPCGGDRLAGAWVTLEDEEAVSEALRPRGGGTNGEVGLQPADEHASDLVGESAGDHGVSFANRAFRSMTPDCVGWLVTGARPFCLARCSERFWPSSSQRSKLAGAVSEAQVSEP